jgi:hypothetical protein
MSQNNQSTNKNEITAIPEGDSKGKLFNITSKYYLDNKDTINGANQSVSNVKSINPQNTQNPQLYDSTKKVQTRGRKSKNSTKKENVEIVVEVTNENGREVIDLVSEEGNDNLAEEKNGSDEGKSAKVDKENENMDVEQNFGGEDNGNNLNTNKVKRKRRTKKEMEEANANANAKKNSNDTFMFKVESDNNKNGEEANQEGEQNNIEKENNVNDSTPKDKKVKSSKQSKEPKTPKVPKEAKSPKVPKEAKPPKTPKEPKAPKPPKKSTILPTNLTPPVQIDTIFDLQPYISPSKSSKTLSNTDMILAIMEICYNSSKYNLTIPSNTREFWKKVYEKPELETIFKKFQPETLRKYWRSIREANNPEKIIELVKSYMDDFNGANVK